MTYLIIGSGAEALGYETALARALGDRQATLRAGADQAGPLLRPEAWEGAVLCTVEQPSPLIRAALAAGIPLLVTDPAGLTASEAVALGHVTEGDPSGISIACFGPISPALATVGLEISHTARRRPLISVQVEAHLPSDASVGMIRHAVLESAITLAHLADWPTRVAAVAGRSEPQRALSLLATCHDAAGTTAGLQVVAGPGAPSRRIRVVSQDITVDLHEDDSRGVVLVHAEESPLAAAAGAERLPGAGPTRIDVAMPDAPRSIVERFLRRRDSGGADDLATLARGLAFAEHVWRSAADDGEAVTVAYDAALQESPRLQLIRGGRADDAPPPAPAGRGNFTVVR